MTDDEQAFTPPRWTLEHDHGNRLARLSNAITEVLETHPDAGPDIKGIFTLHDGHSAGAAMIGYEDHVTTDPIFDLIKQAGILFASVGIKMTVVADNGSELRAFDSNFQPEVPGGFTGEPVRLIIASNPSSHQMATICRSVKESVEGAEGDWSGTKVLILVQEPGEEHASTMMYHGLEDGAAIAHVLMHALQQVVGAEGAQLVMVSMDTITGSGMN